MIYDASNTKFDITLYSPFIHLLTLHSDTKDNRGSTNDMGKRLQEAIDGKLVKDPVGVVKGLPQPIRYKPMSTEAEDVCTFKGRVNREVMESVMKGDFMLGSTRLVESDMIRKWSKGTWQAKKRVVKTFFKFLTATGQLQGLFPNGEPVSDKDNAHRKREEMALCGFAILRVMSGQKPSGAELYVSHVRTWFRTIHQDEFGQETNNKITSNYIASMKKVYEDNNDSKDERREPVTWQMCKMFVVAGNNRNWRDLGVVTVVAYGALFRMGELTATSGQIFDAVKGMTEDRVEFFPTFWNARKITITMGKSKADQSGAGSRLRPRTLEIGKDPTSPGRLLQNLIAKRYSLVYGEEPVLGKSPLFQDTRGGQLKQSTVLGFMRHTLKEAGVSADKTKRYGTHSCRIGGATKLFQMGVSPEAIKLLGGWASDAYKAYIRIQQDDLMNIASKMCE
jgi:hypothetical protein